MKIYTTLILWTAFMLNGFSQPPSDKLKKNPYKNSQWYIGLAAGFNYNTVNVINEYSIIHATNRLDDELYRKDYTLTNNISATYGLKLMYQFEQRFVLGSGLLINELRFSYNQELPGNKRTVVFQHDHHLRYLDLPIYFRFMIRQVNSRMWNRSWKKPGVPPIIPFVQGGLNFSFLINANKEVSRSVIENDFEVQDLSFSEDVGGLLQSTTVGAFIGVGARFKLGNVYLTPELNIRRGFSNVTNDETRYTNDNLTQNAYDVFDDKSFTSLEAVVSILIPLKYLSKREFTPVEI